jgi:hypothetical protein
MSRLRYAAPILLLATSLFAQSYDKVLLPIQPSTISGAFGTTWHTVLAERSDNDSAVMLKCYAGACTPNIPQGGVLFQSSGSGDPAFIYVPSDHTASVLLALRTTVTSGSENATMEIPIAHASDFMPGVVRLQAIPLDRDFRQTLRIYDLDGVDGTAVRVRIYTTSSDPAVDTVVILHTPAIPSVDGLPGAPAFATINNLTIAFPAIATADIANIDVEPMTTGVSIWAFVTSTNNVTQQFNHFVR